MKGVRHQHVFGLKFLREKEERTTADRGSQAQQHANFLICIDLTVGIPTRSNPSPYQHHTAVHVPVFRYQHHISWVVHSQKYVFSCYGFAPASPSFLLLAHGGASIAGSATTESRQTEKPMQPIGSADQEKPRSPLSGVDCCNTTHAAVDSSFASNTCTVFGALGGDTRNKGKDWQCG